MYYALKQSKRWKEVGGAFLNSYAVTLRYCVRHSFDEYFASASIKRGAYYAFSARICLTTQLEAKFGVCRTGHSVASRRYVPCYPSCHRLQFKSA